MRAVFEWQYLYSRMSGKSLEFSMKRSCTVVRLMGRIKLSLDHSFAAEVWNAICSVAFEAHNVRVIFKVIHFLVVF